MLKPCALKMHEKLRKPCYSAEASITGKKLRELLIYCPILAKMLPCSRRWTSEHVADDAEGHVGVDDFPLLRDSRFWTPDEGFSGYAPQSRVQATKLGV